MAQNNKSENKGGSSAGMGAAIGLGMIAAVSAGAYYLYGTKEGAKRRVKIRGWMLKAKGEVLEKLETLKEVNEGTYNALIDNVMMKYKAVKSIAPEEREELIADLKKHWKSINTHLTAATKGKAKPKSAPKKKAK